MWQVWKERGKTLWAVSFGEVVFTEGSFFLGMFLGKFGREKKWGWIVSILIDMDENSETCAIQIPHEVKNVLSQLLSYIPVFIVDLSVAICHIHIKKF